MMTAGKVAFFCGFLGVFLALASSSAVAEDIIDGIIVRDPKDPVARSTVAIGRSRSSDLNDGFEPHCSASLLSRSVAVTAAHCVKGVDRLYVIFSTDARKRGVLVAPVHSVIVAANYREGYGDKKPVPRDNADIALVRFGGGLPPGYVAAKLVPKGYRIRDGDEVIIAGYGKTLRYSSPDDRVGILRKGRTRIRDASYADTEISIDAGYGAQNAGGDSGGPAYVVIDGRFHLFGVCNWGRHDQFAIFALIRAHL